MSDPNVPPSNPQPGQPGGVPPAAPAPGAQPAGTSAPPPPAPPAGQWAQGAPPAPGPQAPDQHGWGAGAPVAPAAPLSSAARSIGWAIVAAGVLGVIGSVMPWISLSGDAAPLVERLLDQQGEGLNGLDKDGVITIILALVAVGFGVARALGKIPKPAAGVALAAGALTALIAIIDIADVSSTKDDLGPLATNLDVSVGAGLWLTLIAGIAIVATAVVALVRSE